MVLQFMAGSRALGVLSDTLLREARLNAVCELLYEGCIVTCAVGPMHCFGHQSSTYACQAAPQGAICLQMHCEQLRHMMGIETWRAHRMQALSCQPSEHEQAVLRLQSERKESAKALRAAKDELAAMLAQQLTSSMPPSERRAVWRLSA